MTNKKEAVLTIFEQIEKRDGLVTPQAIVDEARLESSPIHDNFEWDDNVAGEEHRLWQARQLIKVVVTTYKGKETKAYRNVNVTIVAKEGGDPIVKRGYVSTPRIYSDKQLYHQVLVDLVGRQKMWTSEARDFAELKGIVDEKKLSVIEKRILE